MNNKKDIKFQLARSMPCTFRLQDIGILWAAGASEGDQNQLAEKHPDFSGT